MAEMHVPAALPERLGEDGTEGLRMLLASAKMEWTNDVVTSAVERFDRRLTTEISSLRVDLTREISALRHDFTKDLSSVRVELLKWSFLFWVGQVAAIAGLLAFMRRA
jgi:hypothetical protein